MVDTLSPHMHVAGSNDVDGLPINAATMFADHNGVHKPRIEKKQRKLAEKLSFLKDFLEEGEQLQAVTRAVSPTSFMEQMTTGYIFAYIKRCLLVFTDRRVIHIPTTMSYDYRQSIAQIRYGDLESIVQKGSRLKITYKTGAKDAFLYVRGSERKKIRALLQSVNLQGSTSDAGARVHLCPKCTSELVPNIFECSRCSQEFKSRQIALQKSIWLPGGGYFYTGHPVLGLVDAVVEVFFLVAAIVSVVGGNFAAAGFFALLLIVEKLITVYHANHFVKEYLTTDAARTSSGPVRTTLKWAGTTIFLLFVALGFFGALMDTGVVPSERVLGPDNIPAGHYEELIANGIIDDGEVIEFFYSEGMFSILEGGSVLTDQRVIAYEDDGDDAVSVYYIWNERIETVALTQQGDALNFSVYQVVADEEDVWLDLWLPHEYGDAERFAAAVEAKIAN